MEKQIPIPADRRKRVHRRVLTFNYEENSVVENFLKKYGVQNRSKFFREAIVTAVLQKLEQDHPKLF
jgi:metal-responsive CopG/Arc/MetJ family transcriptional regulator